ncbi:hypothetical protein PPERSA_06809 [Pseudocohnilembus persalinus]|uniref:Protein YIF1 n=1 Tax=Pseudocohnilembus persalinus TaxID=266149 RepID=A0A0V0QSL6_PSEPJ|nr:hypothetical protein PPERSA_06809 [Pseudocohnilembus persalinus]|eukprot:KRX05175.1 hypothetical protein PPERSA_06809 [Pseudocohnilembus persalinus]
MNNNFQNNQQFGQQQFQQGQQANTNPFGDIMGNQFVQNVAKNQLQGFISKAPLNTDFLTSKLFSQENKYYFNVDSKYVLNKLRIILLPFIEKGEWGKSTSIDCWGSNEESGETDQHQGFASPVNNVHAPDLYLPFMGLITFILISCLSVGIGDDFTPSIIQNNLSKCLFISLLEIFLFKIGFFIANLKSGTFLESSLDLASHLNYRYINLTIILILNLVMGGIITFIVLIYLFGSSAFFVYKTLMRYSNDQEEKRKVIYILAGISTFFSYILLKINGAY